MNKSILKQFDLKGQTALITGGNRGLGIEMAKALAEAGANIAIVSRDLKKNKESVEMVRSEYGTICRSYPCDVTDEKVVEGTVKKVMEDFGSIEILINSAGINIRGGIEHLKLEEFQKVMKVNVDGSWLMSKSVVPIMKNQNYGRILNVGSILSMTSLSDRTPYATSKGAVLQLTRSLGVELAPHKITVNAILPGPFATEMNLSLTGDPEKYAAFIRRIPMGRWGELHEIGGLALYLCSPASSYVTASGFSIDGGWVAI